MRYIIDKYGGSLSDILNNRKWYNIHVIGALVKKRRLKELNELQAHKTVENNQTYIGHVGEVLIEGFDERADVTMLYGKYSNFKMVYFPGNPALLNQYVTVRVTGINKNSLMGEMIDA